MAGRTEKINFLSVSMLFITSVGLLNHVTIIPALLSASKRDAWISVLFALTLFLAWIPLVYYIATKTKQQNMYLWVKDHIHPLIAKVFAAGACTYMFCISTVTMKDMVMWTHISYMPTTPQLVIVLLFAILCFSLAATNIRTIAIANGVVLPIVIILGYFVMLSNMKHKDYSLLVPIFEHGYVPVFHGMVFSGAGLVEMLIFIFIQHRVKSPVRYIYLVLTGIFLAWLTLGPTTGAIATFGPEEAAKQRFPAFEQWTLVELTRYIENVDFFSVYQWLSGAFIRISLAMFIIVDLLNLSKIKTRRIILGLLFILMIVLIGIPISDMQFVTFLSDIYLPATLTFMVGLSLVLALFVFMKKKRAAK